MAAEGDAWQPSDAPAGLAPLRPLALGAAVLLTIEAVAWVPLSIAYQWLSVHQSSVLHGMSAPLGPDATLAMDVVVVSGLASVGGQLLAIPLWAAWHARAARNLALLGRPTRTAPVMHWLWWFVPLANLFVSYGAMQQLVEGSRDQPDAPAPRVFATFWIVDVVSRVITGVGYRATPERAGLLLVFGAIAGLLALALYLRLVFRVTRWQDYSRSSTPRISASSGSAG